MEIWHLRYFLAVAQERSFARAADRLHMAPSPLSRRIRDLERELGTELFIRAHHRIDLTAAGADLVPRAADVLARFDAIAHRRDPPRMRVGIAPDVSSGARGAVLAAAAGGSPGAEVELVPASSGPLLAELRAGSLDLAVVHGVVREPGISVVRIESRPVCAVVGPGCGFTGRTSARLEEFAELPFASIEHDAAPGVYGALDETLRAAGVHRRIVVPGANFAGVAQLVASGRAFTLTARDSGTVTRLLRDEAVTFLDVDGAGRLSTVVAWSAARAATEPLIGALIDAIRAIEWSAQSSS